MKKLASCLVLASICMFSFVGCGDTGGTATGDASAEQAATEGGGDGVASPEEAGSGGDEATADTGSETKAPAGGEDKKE